jgi:hypothetical protein
MDKTCNTRGKEDTCIRYEMRPRSRREDNIKMKLKEQGLRLWKEVICFSTGTSAG